MENNTQKLLDVCLAFTKEREYHNLLEVILRGAMSVSNCDAGTLYIKELNELKFKISVTNSLNLYTGPHENSTLPSVSMDQSNVCSYCARENTLVNIEDVYNSDIFDFSGPRKYDELIGYKTTSMLVVPLENDYGEVIGVLQLINALDDHKQSIAFEPKLEQYILSLAAQASICLINMSYAKENSLWLNSFVTLMSAAVDARTAYTANHSKNMVLYAEKFIEWLSLTENEWTFSETNKRQFFLSIWLHDIGKLVIPLDILDKPDRLFTRLEPLMIRLQMIEMLTVNRFLKKEIALEEQNAMFLQLKQAKELILQVNVATFVPKNIQDQIREMGEWKYIDYEGNEKPWLEEEDLTSLLIQKGTLTSAERDIVESHVVMTRKMLSDIQFPRDYTEVVNWASNHHEFINGNGYPMQLSGDQIPVEVRLITILDIYDALTALDRPYRSAMKSDQAFDILDQMAVDGELDERILTLFKESKVYLLN